MENTRYARVHESLSSLRRDDVTRVQKLVRLPRAFGFREAFSASQRVMASAVREQRRSGLYVFAVHEEYGLVARLWLEASAQPRAGVIGRHDFADLPLPGDDAISLRHLFFVVRKQGDAVHFTALDLETSNGLRLEDERTTRRVEASGPLFLAATKFIFFCVPTGQPLTWDPDSATPWSTLLPRVGDARDKRIDEARGPVVGRVELSGPTGLTSSSFTKQQLERGVLVGRASRCDAQYEHDHLSRVHVVLLKLGDEVFLFDSGSTNGTWRGDDEVKATCLRDGDTLELGDYVVLTWRRAN